MARSYDLTRFVAAQQGSYQSALSEIRRGRKTGHWIWYIFPQIDGLGMSSTAQYYAIGSLEEAAAYAKDPVLGARLTEICRALMELDTDDADYIFGWPDNLKLRSSMTLFELADPDDGVYGRVLDKFYAGERDERTLHILGLDR